MEDKDYMPESFGSPRVEDSQAKRSLIPLFIRDGSWQILIPGWNLVYLIRERRAYHKAAEERSRRTELNLNADLALARGYVRSMNRANALGDDATEDRYQEQFVNLVAQDRPN